LNLTDAVKTGISHLINFLKVPIHKTYSTIKCLVVVIIGQTEDYFSESERLVQLARYHREVQLASQQESFVTVATMVGLQERQQEQVVFR